MKLKSNPAQTVLTITVGFLVIHLITHYRWPLYLAAVVGVSGVFSLFLAQKIEWLWHKLAGLLSLLVPNILLSLLFFLFLMPIALLRKLFQRSNFLQLKNATDSTWIKRDQTFTSRDLNNPW